MLTLLYDTGGGLWRKTEPRINRNPLECANSKLFWTHWSLSCQDVMSHLYTVVSLNEIPYNSESSTQSVLEHWCHPLFVQMYAHILTQFCSLLISQGQSLSELSILPTLPHASYLSPSLSDAFTNILYTTGTNYHCTHFSCHFKKTVLKSCFALNWRCSTYSNLPSTKFLTINCNWMNKIKRFFCITRICWINKG